jgi:putative hydroxymethylpyrimidine transport system substrate-binding protein
MGRVAASLAAVLVTATALVACGGGDGAEPDAPDGATLVLDFQPNAVHAPLYAAQARGYMEDAGIELDIREPSSSADGAKLLEAGRADFAILDINDFGIARERGLDLVAVAGIVGRPLASVIAVDPDAVRTPADLDGKKVGVTGVPSDDAVLDTVLADGGLEPGAVERETIGFNAVSALGAGTVDAATAFWNAEGVELRRQGISTQEFRVDEFGAPRYPELVLVTKGDGEGNPAEAELTCELVEGLAPAYATLSTDPQAVVEDMLGELDTLDATSQEAQFAELIAADAFSPQEKSQPDAALNKGAVAGWAEWAAGRGLLEPGAPKLDQAFLPNLITTCAKAG